MVYDINRTSQANHFSSTFSSTKSILMNFTRKSRDFCPMENNNLYICQK